MNDKRITLKFAALAVLIILAGLPLRFDLAQRLYLDFDEAMYFQAANEPTLADSWEHSRIHTHPPLAFLMYHLWLPVGNSEFVLRLPSILFGAIATWIAYLWLARMTDRRAALVGVFVLTFAMPVLHVSAQMRSYSFLFACLFGALWFDERFRESGRVRHLLGQTVCLVLALLMHYAAAWVMGVLGIVGLIRAAARGVHSTASRAWIASQVVLAGACVWLYLTHIRGFVGSMTQDQMWESWMRGNPLGETITGRLMFALIGGGRFFGSMFGFAWLPMLCVAAAGVWFFTRQASGAASAPRFRGDSASLSGDESTGGLTPPRSPEFVGLERALLVALPFLFAVLLQAAKIYPLGATRHSLWLIPFVALALSAAVRPLLAQPRAAWRIGVAVMCLAWAWWYPYRVTTQFSTTLTPALMQQTAAKLKATIRRDELILTDDGTRNVLAYYLGRDKSDRGHEIADGFREYHFDGFRIVTIPKFHFFMYSLRDDWSSFVSSIGEHSTQPLWLVYMGFEVPDNDLKSLGQRLPPAKMLARHKVGDNHLLRLQFREPQPVAQAARLSRASP